jgi:hypothetical protein
MSQVNQIEPLVNSSVDENFDFDSVLVGRIAVSSDLVRIGFTYTGLKREKRENACIVSTGILLTDNLPNETPEQQKARRLFNKVITSARIKGYAHVWLYSVIISKD